MRREVENPGLVLVEYATHVSVTQHTTGAIDVMNVKKNKRATIYTFIFIDIVRTAKFIHGSQGV